MIRSLSPSGMWTASLTAALGLHIALALVLGFALGAQSREPTGTRITIETVDRAPALESEPLPVVTAPAEPEQASPIEEVEVAAMERPLGLATPAPPPRQADTPLPALAEPQMPAEVQEEAVLTAALDPSPAVLAASPETGQAVPVAQPEPALDTAAATASPQAPAAVEEMPVRTDTLVANVPADALAPSALDAGTALDTPPPLAGSVDTSGATAVQPSPSVAATSEAGSVDPTSVTASASKLPELSATPEPAAGAAANAIQPGTIAAAELDATTAPSVASGGEPVQVQIGLATPAVPSELTSASQHTGAAPEPELESVSTLAVADTGIEVVTSTAAPIGTGVASVPGFAAEEAAVLEFSGSAETLASPAVQASSTSALTESLPPETATPASSIASVAVDQPIASLQPSTRPLSAATPPPGSVLLSGGHPAVAAAPVTGAEANAALPAAQAIESTVPSASLVAAPSGNAGLPAAQAIGSTVPSGNLATVPTANSVSAAAPPTGSAIAAGVPGTPTGATDVAAVASTAGVQGQPTLSAAPLSPQQGTAVEAGAAVLGTDVADLPSVTATEDDSVSPAPDAAAPAGFGELVSYLEGYDGGECFAAFPVQMPDGSIIVSAYAADTDAAAAVGDVLADEFGPLPTEVNTLSSSQCGAVSFARTLPGYPRRKPNLILSERTIPNGAMLQGRVDDTKGREVYLLVVDDEGIVSSADKFVAADGASVTFEAPVFLTGDRASALQLLVAITSDVPLQNVGAFDGFPVERFFSELTLEQLIKGVDITIAINSFVVE